MALKIRKTNKQKSLEFRILKDEGIDGKNILTPDGFKPIHDFQFIKNDKTLVVSTANGRIVCHPMHRFMVWSGESRIDVFAQDLDAENHKLIGYYDEKLDFAVEDGGYEDLYDIEVPSPNYYYTSGVISHNSVFLVNNAISSLRGSTGDGKNGQDVLFITFEMDVLKTALRAIGTSTNIPLHQINDHQDMIRRILNTMKHTLKKRLLIHEMAPDECSVSHIYALLDSLRRREGWRPDVVILDYMDLMISRNPSYNKDDYGRQKHVANEIRGLAKNENVLVFTATQTNRAGAGEEIADLTKAAESFGKQFALDYVISLNQSTQDRTAKPPRLRMFVAKNRNGPKHELISCEIDYDTMVVREM